MMNHAWCARRAEEVAPRVTVVGRGIRRIRPGADGELARPFQGAPQPAAMRSAPVRYCLTASQVQRCSRTFQASPWIFLPSMMPTRVANFVVTMMTMRPFWAQ